jgi:1,4-dihydroxy-2-naphthoyl-CoA hydrolase
VTNSSGSDQGLSGAIDADLAGDFVRHLGVEFDEHTGDRVVARWKAEPKLHQPYGIVHGGVHCSVIETLASVGAAMWLGDRGKVVGVNNNTDFYRAVTEGELVSTATPLHRGRSQQVWLVETRDAEGRVSARGQVRLQNLYAERAATSSREDSSRT